MLFANVEGIWEGNELKYFLKNTEAKVKME